MKEFNLILDTDVGSDCDDMIALAYLVYAEKCLNVSLKEIVYSNGCEFGVPAIRALLRSLGASKKDIGTTNSPLKSYDNYCKQIAEKFCVEDDFSDTFDAVSLMRKTLVENDNNIICGIGSLTNISDLLLSKADNISDLNGIELIKQKCKKIVVMAGDFRKDAKPEWNVKLDVKSSQNLVEFCPIPLVFIPFETGLDVISGGPILKKFDEANPLSMSFKLFPGVTDRGGRHSWDPITTIYAVEGCKDFLQETKTGTVIIDHDGRTVFSQALDGLHSVVNLKDNDSRIKIAEYIDTCVLKILDN